MDPGQEQQEKEEKMDFSRDVFSHLCALESGARCRARRLETRERRWERLRERLRELRGRRQKMHQNLRRARERGRIPRDPREALEWKIRKCRELLRVLGQLGGIFRVEPRIRGAEIPKIQ